MAAETLILPPPLPSPEAIRQTATEVLQRPDYVLQPGADLSFIVRFLQSLISALQRAFDSLYQVSPALAFATFIILSLVGLLLVVHVIYTLRTVLAGPRRIAGATGMGEETVELPAAWEQTARQSATQGDYLGAIRCLLRASLLHLEAARKKPLQRGQTNREYLRRFRSTPAFEPLRCLVEVVDLKWYGGAPCSKDDYDAGAQAYAQLQEAARAAASAQGRTGHADRA